MSAFDTLETLVEAVEALDDSVAKGRARALVTGVLEMHREGLERVLEILAEEEGGDARIKGLAADPALASLLMLHDLHPSTPLERVEAALASIDAELRGLGARVHDVRVEGAFVRVRLTRDDDTRHGAEIRQRVTAAVLQAAPDVELLLEGAEDGPALISPSRLSGGR